MVVLHRYKDKMDDLIKKALDPNDSSVFMTIYGEIIMSDVGYVVPIDNNGITDEIEKPAPYAGVNFITFPKEDALAIYKAMNKVSEKYGTQSTEQHREVFGDDAALALERLADRLDLVDYGDGTNSLCKYVDMYKSNDKDIHKKTGIKTIG